MGHWSVEVALTMTSLLFGPWTASMMEDPAEREVAGEALIELQLARANAKRADWARPVKFDGFWKHPKANSKMAHNNEQHEFKSARYKLTHIWTRSRGVAARNNCVPACKYTARRTK